MKRALTIILFAFLCATLFGQTKMQFRDPFWVDTTSADFQGIVRLWNDYKSSLVSEQSPTAFWMESEVATYGNPDLLIQSFTLSKYDFMDFMGGKELFIGVEKRNDTLFEMRTMLFGDFPTENQLTGVFTYPVVKVAENEYKFYSKLSLLKPDMKSYQVGWVTYFYPYNYPFDKEAADQTFAIANEFAAAMGLEKSKPVEYYLFNDRTEYFRYLGADVSCYDFIGCGRVYPHGFAFADCNKVFFTKGGESLAHENGLKVAVAYPNPGKDVLNIRTGLRDAWVEVYDLNGRLVHRQDITENVTAINTTNWTDGTYVWRVISNGKEAESGKWIRE